MRFVPSVPPADFPAGEDEPRPVRAVGPVRRVEARMRVPQVFPRFRRKVRPVEESVEPVVESVVQETRTIADRRKWCRRLLHTHPVLDTRSGEERRKRSGRSKDIATTLDEKV